MIQKSSVSITLALESFSQAILIDHVKPADEVQYILCAESWCRLIRSCVSEPLAMDLRRAINQFGLYSCIADADSFAKSYLANEERLAQNGLFRLWTSLVRYCDVSWYGLEELNPYDGANHKYVNGCFACEVVLRFPKRFTVSKPDTAAALAKFKEVHKDVRVFTHSPWRQPGTVVLMEVRRKMREILIPSSRRAIARAIRSYINDLGHFSSGSAFYPNQIPNTSAVPALKYGWMNKVDGVAYYDHDYFKPLCPYPNGESIAIPRFLAKVMAVPKDYETSRMIAPETPTLNREASRVRGLLLSLTAATGALESMPPEDQSLNRERARIGSLHAMGHRIAESSIEEMLADDNLYATIDLSHASDSISRDLFFAVLPYELHSIVRNALSDGLVLDGTDPWTGKPGLETVTPYLLATSGSVLTPILQSCFYLAIARYACDLAGCSYDCVSVYNDDIVCTEKAFQTVCELLQTFGLTINQKKTFHADNPFRESCGGEYVGGVDVSGFYWPRKAVRIRRTSTGLTADDASLATLVAMQHKLYSFVYVRDLLNDVVTTAMQKATYSPAYTDTTDLWADFMDDIASLKNAHWCQATNWVKPDTSKWTSSMKTLFTVGRCVHEHCSYYQYLERGPIYSDSLSELLIVSEQVESYQHSQFVGSPIYKVRKPVIR